MAKSGLSRSQRKYIRKEKARIRREYLNSEDGEKKLQDFILKMYQEPLKKK
jgi:hypothetical protein